MNCKVCKEEMTVHSTEGTGSSEIIMWECPNKHQSWLPKNRRDDVGSSRSELKAITKDLKAKEIK